MNRKMQILWCVIAVASVVIGRPVVAADKPKEDKRPVHKVKTVEELITAMGSDRIIELHAKDLESARAWN